MLTKKDMESVALLSRLDLTEEESDALAGHINKLLESFRMLGELDTDDVEPTSHVVPVANVFREDVVTPSITPEEVLANAPEEDEDSFVVPRIVED